MTGQDILSSVKTFDEAIQLTGAIMTKMDGDSRGGAAMSAASRRAGTRSEQSMWQRSHGLTEPPRR